MNISIPQMITGIVTMFVVILTIRVFDPILSSILTALPFTGSLLYGVKITIYLCYMFIIYIYAFSYIMGRKPNILAEKREMTE